MPYKIDFFGDADLVTVRLTGKVSLPEIKTMLDEIPGKPWFRKGLKMIVDARKCTTDMRGKDIEALAAHAKRLDADWGETKWAVLAQDDLVYGLARVYMAVTADFNVDTHVFRTVPEADHWLNLSDGIETALRRPA